MEFSKPIASTVKASQLPGPFQIDADDTERLTYISFALHNGLGHTEWSKSSPDTRAGNAEFAAILQEHLVDNLKMTVVTESLAHASTSARGSDVPADFAITPSIPSVTASSSIGSSPAPSLISLDLIRNAESGRYGYAFAILKNGNGKEASPVVFTSGLNAKKNNKKGKQLKKMKKKSAHEVGGFSTNYHHEKVVEAIRMFLHTRKRERFARLHTQSQPSKAATIISAENTEASSYTNIVVSPVTSVSATTTVISSNVDVSIPLKTKIPLTTRNESIPVAASTSKTSDTVNKQPQETVSVASLSERLASQLSVSFERAYDSSMMSKAFDMNPLAGPRKRLDPQDDAEVLCLTTKLQANIEKRRAIATIATCDAAAASAQQTEPFITSSLGGSIKSVGPSGEMEERYQNPWICFAQNASMIVYHVFEHF